MTTTFAARSKVTAVQLYRNASGKWELEAKPGELPAYMQAEAAIAFAQLGVDVDNEIPILFIRTTEQNGAVHKYSGEFGIETAGRVPAGRVPCMVDMAETIGEMLNLEVI